MQKKKKATSDIPYPNTLLIPQYRTDEILHSLIEKRGLNIEYNKEIVNYTQSKDIVSATLSSGETVHCKYLVGADGGSSTVRKLSGINFIGETNEEDRMIIVDGIINGLKRNRWHIWPKTKGKQVAACPLPNSNQFQVMIRINPNEKVNLNETMLSQRFKELTEFELTNITWSSIFRPNVRLAEKYRKGRVFIAGDAAHVHTPAGAQGLNTGIQDAYNLGWKLSQSIKEGDEKLLDSYESERQPIAARVLKKSNELYSEIENQNISGLKRGDEERQLSISYYGGPLANASNEQTKTLKSGDRAPDAIYNSAHNKKRLFELYQGSHFTFLAFGETSSQTILQLKDRFDKDMMKMFVVGANTSKKGYINDFIGNIQNNYGISEYTLILIRPDGYIGAIITSDFQEKFEKVLNIFEITYNQL
ncbi:monooxygenase, FAD-binding protein [Staphylococcus xylosus]|uniref:FAD-dependent monooxygenase n=1 Tax=Staphylococcus xylosus TaxID=1288 RepID=UPI000869C1D1|nr:FAD-dependent monooxygenase [Staphylococcus xylosus]SCU23665.1 monooxygenase, FAD-binding protein [Staphylococcus xylosus]